MKPAIAFFLILFFYSCAQKNEQSKLTAVDVSRDSIDKLKNTPGSIKKSSQVLPDDKWKRYQDSLRREILNRKENKILKESFLQEMYIRDAVTVSNDSLLVMIPFNLHGPDCGSPDSYSTDISFGFKPGDKLTFPQTLPFREHEHGKVEKEMKLSGDFQLVEQTAKHVIYYSPDHKRTLVLFSAQQNGTSAFYFTGLEKDRINGNNVYRIIDEYDEQDKNALYPITSWILTTNEYENFL